MGDEEYSADGSSIKKTQHAAASEAIQNTKYKHPPLKFHPTRGEPSNTNLTPTVELNALAMKRREKAVYIFEESQMAAPPNVGASPHHQHQHHPVNGGNMMAKGMQPPPMPTNGAAPYNGQHAGGAGGGGQYNQSNYMYRGGNMMMPAGTQGGMGPPLMGGGAGYHPNRRYGPPPPPHVGKSAGGGMMDRRHMKRFPPSMMNGGGGGYGMMVAQELLQVTLEIGGRQFVGIGPTIQAARHDAASKALVVLKPITTTEGEASTTGPVANDDPKADSKSPVSLIHEIALKRDMTVGFQVKSETGPSHMKVFVTACTVGDITVSRVLLHGRRSQWAMSLKFALF